MIASTRLVIRGNEPMLLSRRRRMRSIGSTNGLVFRFCFEPMEVRKGGEEYSLHFVTSQTPGGCDAVVS